MTDPWSKFDHYGPASDDDQATDHRDGVDPIVCDRENDIPAAAEEDS